MRVSHRYRFVFLSKYKCASDAVRAALDPFSDIVSTQHYPWYHHTPLAPLTAEFELRGYDWSSYFIFTTVRNPYTMLNSLYAYGMPARDGSMWWDRLWDDVVNDRQLPVERRIPSDPAPFREWVLEHDFTRFTLDPFVRDETGRVCTDAILRVENLEDDFRLIAEKLRLSPLPQLSLTNTTTYLPEAFDKRMAARVREVFRTDFELGGYPCDPPQRL